MAVQHSSSITLTIMLFDQYSSLCDQILSARTSFIKKNFKKLSKHILFLGKNFYNFVSI